MELKLHGVALLIWSSLLFAFPLGGWAARPIQDEDEMHGSLMQQEQTEQSAESSNATSDDDAQSLLSLLSTRDAYGGDFMFMTASKADNEKKYMDGALTSQGAEAIVNRIAAMSGRPIAFLSDEVDTVMVAPTLAAIQTALATIILTRRGADGTKPYPTFKLSYELRPRGEFKPYPSGSIRAILTAFIKKICTENGQADHEWEIQRIGFTLASNYEAFLKLVPNKDIQVAPRDALEVYSDIHQLKLTVSKQHTKKILMVGDRTLATWMFMVAIPRMGGWSEIDDDVATNAYNLARSIPSLAYAAPVLVTWEIREYRAERDGVLKLFPGDQRYTFPFFSKIICKGAEYGTESSSAGSLKRGLLTFDPTNIIKVGFDQVRYIALELKAVRTWWGASPLLPAGADWDHYHLRKKTKHERARGYGAWKDRIVSIVSLPSEHQAFVTWSGLFFEEHNGMQWLNELALQDITSGMVDFKDFVGKLLMEGPKRKHWILGASLDDEEDDNAATVLKSFYDEFYVHQARYVGWQ
eukprot:CAMPEP_0178426748 /NCGR_PEP_ID=MMETSP0689_2-20121128/29392_1 /TAXON_ID=160604 /ORGANISM="Amphidinium massartii, Strain CS-259" /LENGTH=524 /DNA_ID=CAMNT_0020048439 /DNA_START=90 /DNA_END=1661 /DNA_ORIENTATION=-